MVLRPTLFDLVIGHKKVYNIILYFLEAYLLVFFKYIFFFSLCCFFCSSFYLFSFVLRPHFVFRLCVVHAFALYAWPEKMSPYYSRIMALLNIYYDSNQFCLSYYISSTSSSVKGIHISNMQNIIRIHHLYRSRDRANKQQCLSVP